MEDLNILSKTKYKIKFSEGIYYPAMLDIVEFGKKGEPYIRKEGVAGIDFYIPEKSKLIHKYTVIDISNLKHLNFLDLKKEAPKVFIYKGLAEILTSGDYLSEISSFLIKSTLEVENYKEYFKIFKIKEPRNIFSRFAGTSLFSNFPKK